MLRGAPERLLDTYDSERQPHAQSWIEQATRLSVTIQTTDTDVAAGRDAFLRTQPEDAIAVVPGLGPGLHEHTGDDDSAGFLSVQPVFDDGRRFDDLVGAGFVVVVTAELVGPLADEVREALDESALVHRVREGDPGFDELLASVDAKAAVIRPDHYVLGVARTAEQFDELARHLLAIVDLPDANGRNVVVATLNSDVRA